MEIHKDRRRGRGAVSNASGRYENSTYHSFDDGWESLAELEPFKTSVREEKVKSIISRNESPDIAFDQSLNPYRGCEHGCIYCYARPGHAYLGLSPGLDFETKLVAKINAAEILRKELSKRSYQVKPLAIGGVTDPYQPIEKHYQITRQLLELCLETRHPLGIVTKSGLILRDTDLLSELARLNLVRVAISVTTLDHRLARLMEPRATTPMRRLEVISKLSKAGIPITVMTAPIIPALNDHEIERLLSDAYSAGATSAGYVMLRLPLEIHGLFEEWLAEYFPDRARHVMTLMRDIHNGKVYRSDFGLRQKGSGAYASQISKRFKLACRRLGLNERSYKMRTDLFRPPQQDDRQLRLFE